jgi:hypothetical protein
MSRSRAGSLFGRRRRFESGSRARLASEQHTDGQADRKSERDPHAGNHVDPRRFAGAGRVDGTVSDTRSVRIADSNRSADARAQTVDVADGGSQQRTDRDADG